MSKSNKTTDDRLRWQKERVDPLIAKSPEKNLAPSSKHVTDKERLYTPEETINYGEDLGFPGTYPFTRGVYPTMYRSRHWTMRQYAGFATAKESNARYRYLLEQGQTGLSVAFDLPTQMGYDSDHAMAKGEVGRVGVAIDTLDDMRTLFDQIPLDQISTSMTINATAAILLVFYLAVAQEQGVEANKLRGTVQNDILKEYMARGTYIYPPGPSLRLITDLMDYCAREVPQWNTVSISGYHIREAGSTAIQEVAFTLADGIAYVQAAKDRGLDIQAIGKRLSFFFNVQNDLIEEVAKFRAARKLWAKIMRERFATEDPKSWLLRFHAQTAGSSLTAQQPDNNIIRVTLQALAAVLGGAQSIHTNSMDEALGLPTQEAVTIALRTQQVIAFESGVTQSVDPLGGSYMLESLTKSIEVEATNYIEHIDQMGGMVRAIEQGFPQREIQDAAYEMQQQIEAKKRIVVGVNQFETEDKTPPILKIDPQLERDQVERLQAFRKQRDTKATENLLGQIKTTAQGSGNLMPLLLEAVKKGATLGEISDTLREVFGVYHEVQVV